jgi:Domain of unknown function (DUF4384)
MTWSDGPIRRNANRLQAVSLTCVCVAFTILATTAHGQAESSQVARLKGELAKVSEMVLAHLGKGNPAGKAATIAVAPLLDSQQARPTVLGVLAADQLTALLTASRPKWLYVGRRVGLPSMSKEHRLWLATMIKKPSALVGPLKSMAAKADYILLGVSSHTDEQVALELRLVNMRSGAIVLSERIALRRTRAMMALLQFLERDDKGRLEDLAAVSRVSIQIFARRSLADGEVLAWEVKEKAVLRQGDQFRMRFSTDADSHVTVFLLGPDGRVQRLFPTADWEARFGPQLGRPGSIQDKYCRAEQDYSVPGPDAKGVHVYYRLDAEPGSNTIYVCAKRAVIANVSELQVRVGATTGDKERLAILRAVFDHVEAFEFRQ